MKDKSSILDKYSILDIGIFPKEKLPEDDRLPANNKIALCEKWLFKFTEPQARFNDHFSSYDLKHQVEEWAGTYVSNGAFIFAAVSLKYPVKVLEHGPNAIFGIKLLTPEEKWKHVRPTGFSKWLFKYKNENSVIGDLARDAITDKKWPRKSDSFIEFWDYLANINACAAAIDSLSWAWEVYSGQKAPAPNNNIMEKCNAFYEGEVDIINFGETYRNAPDGSTYIYVLFEEIGEYNTRKVRYVGQSVSPSQRLQQHTVTPGNLEKVKWVGGLLNGEKKPLMAIIDCVPLNEAIQMERTYINAFIRSERQENQPYSDVLLNKSLI